MNRRLALLAVYAFAVMGCQSTEPPKAAPVAPFAVEEDGGIRHELYRGVAVDRFSDQLALAPGSADIIDLEKADGPRVFAVVRVAERSEGDLSATRFETTFRLKNGRTIVKRWQPAEGRKLGSVLGVFMLPEETIGGQTAVLIRGG